MKVRTRKEKKKIVVKEQFNILAPFTPLSQENLNGKEKTEVEPVTLNKP